MFPSIKYIKEWDTFKRAFIATAESQDVRDALDSSYAPSAPAEVALFNKKQKYIYLVFLAKVRDPSLHAIVIGSPPDKMPQC